MCYSLSFFFTVESPGSDAPRTHSLPADAPPTHTPPVDASPTHILPADTTEEDKEVSELKSQMLRNSVSLDEDDFRKTKDIPQYLTILRSDNDVIVRSNTDGRVPSHRPGLEKKGAGPPVPPRKRRYVLRRLVKCQVWNQPYPSSIKYYNHTLAMPLPICPIHPLR